MNFLKYSGALIALLLSSCSTDVTSAPATSLTPVSYSYIVKRLGSETAGLYFEEKWPLNGDIAYNGFLLPNGVLTSIGLHAESNAGNFARDQLMINLNSPANSELHNHMCAIGDPDTWTWRYSDGSSYRELTIYVSFPTIGVDRCVSVSFGTTAERYTATLRIRDLYLSRLPYMMHSVGKIDGTEYHFAAQGGSTGSILLYPLNRFQITNEQEYSDSELCPKYVVTTTRFDEASQSTVFLGLQIPVADTGYDLYFEHGTWTAKKE